MVEGSGIFNFLFYLVLLFCFYVIFVLRVDEFRDLKEGVECNGVIN